MDQAFPSKNVARALRRRMTPTERFVWKQIRKRQLGFHFRRQHRLGGYVVDFYCHRARLCVELDGEGHQTYNRDRDRERDAVLSEFGFMTLRFKNEEVALNWGECAVKIREACEARDRGVDSELGQEDSEE